jgi:hypothetical protein
VNSWDPGELRGTPSGNAPVLWGRVCESVVDQLVGK